MSEAEPDLMQKGHRLGLLAASTHQLLEVGLQKHNGLPAPVELGMHDQRLFDQCWSKMLRITSSMRKAIETFATENGIDMKKIETALRLSLCAWQSDLDAKKSVIVTPLIIEVILEMDCWLDPFKDPSPDAKATKNTFCNRYDETSHRLAHLRTIATLDSLGEGIHGLIRRLKAIGGAGGTDGTVRTCWQKHRG